MPPAADSLKMNFNSLSLEGSVSLPQEVVVPEKEETKKKNKYSVRQWIIMAILALGNFSVGACSSIQAPFLPHEAEKKGASPSEYGLVFGFYQISVFLSALLFGKIASSVTPKFFANSGMLIIGVCVTLFGFLDMSPPGTTFIAFAYLTRIVEGIGSAAVRTSTANIVAENFPNSVATVFSSLETFKGLGYMIGPALGGILYDLGGFRLPFLTMGLISLVDAVLIFVFLPKGESAESKSSGNLFKFLFHHSILVDCLVIYLSYFCIGLQHVALEPHLRQFGLTGSQLGLIFVLNGAAYSILTPIWGRITDRGVHPRALNICGEITLIITFLIIGPPTFMPFETQLWLVIISQVLFGGSEGGLQICAFFSSLRNTKERGYPQDVTTYAMVSAMFTAANALGSFSGPSIGGALLENYDFREATDLYLVVILVVLLVTSAHYVYIKHKKPKVEEIPEDRRPLLRTKTSSV